MQACVLTLIVVIFAFHASCEAAKESIALETSNDQSLHNTAPSRVKRGNYDNYDMLRLTRGLHMLRLGKRGGYAYEPEIDQEQILTLEDKYPEYQSYLSQLSPEEIYNALSSMEDSYKAPALRYRRSTPSENPMVTPATPLEDGSVEDLSLPEDSKIDEDDDTYLVYPDWLYDDGDVSGWEEKDPNAEKRSLSMLRLGKRQLPMLRLGKREDDAMKRSLSMLRLGKRQNEDLNDQFTDADEKRSLSMLRLGKKRNLNMLRLGKREFDADEKRNLNMLRLGKKRNLNMLRLGKRQLNMLRLGKRQLNMLRLGKRQLNMLRLGKRQMNMLRLGKRQLNMLRLGKREDVDDKRNLQMLRLGKRPAEADKRNLQMLRLGKRSVDAVSEKKEE